MARSAKVRINRRLRESFQVAAWRCALSLPAELTPDRWIIQLFSAKAVAEGGIVRRRVVDVERLVGRPRFLAEVRRRGFRAVENSGQFIVFCNRDPVRLLE